MAVKPIPDGHLPVTPYLIVEDADHLVHFLIQVFGADEGHRVRRQDGSICHAVMHIGASPIMLAEASGDWTAVPSSVHLYVEDVDLVYQRALEHGADSLMTPQNQYYGDRNAGVRDPCGNFWWIATHIEDVSMEEIEQRAKHLV